MNQHLQSMKDAMKNYSARVEKARGQMAQNSKYFKPEEAEKANSDILERLKADGERVKTYIEDVREKAHKEYESWGQLDGSKITDDAKLLQNKGLSVDQFKALAEKYRNNATMTDLLLKYANEHGSNGGGGFSAVWNYSGGNQERKPHYDTSGLQTAEEKTADFDRYADSALVLTERLSNVGPAWGDGHMGKAFVDLSVESFGDDAQI